MRSIELDKALVERLEVLTDIAEAEEDIRKKRTYTTRQVKDRLKARFPG